MSEVAVVPDVARAAAELFVEATAGAVAARGKAAVALTGGSTAAHVQVAGVHRLRGEAKDLDAEAARAARDLRETLGTPPRLDLMLLGLGPDGHILSLFAGVPQSAERGDEQLVRHVAAPTQVEPKVARLTLTPFLLVTARTVVLQVSGAKKAAVLARALEGREDLVACPAQWLRKAAGRAVVVCDAEAASAL